MLALVLVCTLSVSSIIMEGEMRSEQLLIVEEIELVASLGKKRSSPYSHR
jgi:hypothetical protein